MTYERRPRSQVFYRYLPGAVFHDRNFWHKVEDLGLREISAGRDQLLNEVWTFVSNWTANANMPVDLFPKRPQSYLFGEVTSVNYALFPLVFYCTNRDCRNAHAYSNLTELRRLNPKLTCQFCKRGRLVQYPYVLIHRNGDIQQLLVKTNKGETWWERYEGIRMHDTRRFTTATWYDAKRGTSLGLLGTKRTNLPLPLGMTPSLSGTNLGDGDVFYPVLRSFVNLQTETLEKRKEHKLFTYYQLAALLDLDVIDLKNYASNFETVNQTQALQNLLSAASEKEKSIILELMRREGISIDSSEDRVSQTVDRLFHNEVPHETVKSDRSLHEFVFTWYENNGTDLTTRIEETSSQHDVIQETQFQTALSEARNMGIQTAMLVERFPVLTLGIGFTRKSYDRTEAVLNPFKQRIDGRERIVIPVLRNDNEAIVFKLDPLRVLAWLHVNECIDPPLDIRTPAEAHVFLYQRFVFHSYTDTDISRLTPSSFKGDPFLVSSIMAFRLLHTVMHVILQAGKSVLGLDIDSMSEYLFPSALAGALYVAKLQGGGMGALIAAFENDLARWLRHAYDKAHTCLYDPVCREHGGSCHACQYVKFSCRYFNHGLSRNLLTGGIIPDWDEHRPLEGYLSSKVDEVIADWQRKA
jgi:hypothetical protein